MADEGAPPVTVQRVQAQAKPPRLSWWRRTRMYGLSRRQLAWLLFLPSVIVLIGVLGYPAGRTVYISLTTDRLDMPFLGQPYVGLKNYIFILQQQDFWSSLGVSAYF